MNDATGATEKSKARIMAELSAAAALLLAAMGMLTACSDSDGGGEEQEPAQPTVSSTQVIRIEAGRDVYFVLGNGEIIGPYTSEEAAAIEEPPAEEPTEEP